MTEPQALPYEELSAWGNAPGNDGYDGLDGYDDPWDDHPRQAPLRQVPPWYRSPRLLLVLIGLAAAILVMATALLVTGRQSGEMPATPRLETRTSVAVSPTPTNAAPSRTPTSASTSPSSTPEQSTEPEVTAEPAEPAPSQPASAAPPASQSRSPEGPRINVTRTPMSFAPGKVG